MVDRWRRRDAAADAAAKAAAAAAMGAFDEYKRDAEQRLPGGWTYMVRRPGGCRRFAPTQGSRLIGTAP